MFGKLDSQFKSQLFTMAMNVEHHADCLVKVFQVLSQLPDALSFPWKLSSGDEVTANECWAFVAEHINTQGQRNTLKCASLEFLSRMVIVMHDLISSQDPTVASQASKALTDFSRLTLESSSPSESVELRLCTAQVLAHTNVTGVMLETEGSLADVPYVLWLVVVNLLRDDEPVVRERMALGFAVLLKRIQTSSLIVGVPVESCAMVAPLSVETAMLCVWGLFINRQPVVCLSWMLEWIRGDLTCEACNQEDDMSDVDRLFEKGPLNIYAEDSIVTRVACKIVKQGIDVNDGTALLTLKQHKKGVTELLKDQLEKCVVFLERLLLENWEFNRNIFGLFYRAFAGLAVIVMLTQKLAGDISSLQSRITGIVRAVRKPGDTRRILFHPMMKECVQELCALLVV